MGDNILVAPIFEGEKKRKVFLPAGKWYDFYTGEPAGENQVIETEQGLDKIPLFVKDGAIIPMIPAQRQTPKPGEILQLEVRYYGSAESSFELYDDDGETFNYEQGEYSKTLLKVSKNKKGLLQGNQPEVEKGKPFHYLKKINWKFMTPESKNK